MPKIKIPTKRERLLKRKFPKAFREDSMMGNRLTVYVIVCFKGAFWDVYFVFTYITCLIIRIKTIR